VRKLGKNSGFLEALGVIFAGAGIVIALVELFAKRCPDCGQKLVVKDNGFYCNRCHVHVYAQ
jgi:Zn finger protein HypA/HybF involved in hydrogenase expression